MSGVMIDSAKTVSHKCHMVDLEDMPKVVAVQVVVDENHHGSRCALAFSFRLSCRSVLCFDFIFSFICYHHLVFLISFSLSFLSCLLSFMLSSISCSLFLSHLRSSSLCFIYLPYTLHRTRLQHHPPQTNPHIAQRLRRACRAATVRPHFSLLEPEPRSPLLTLTTSLHPLATYTSSTLSIG